MSLIDYINKESIIIDLKETDKECFLSKMIEKLDSLGLLINKDEVEHAIMAREQLMSTGIGNGIAIPHAKTDSVNNIIISIATIKNGINYKSIDKNKVFVVFMLLTPKNSSSENLKVLTSIAKIFRDNSNFLEKLINAKKSQEIIELISKEEMKI